MRGHVRRSGGVGWGGAEWTRVVDSEGYLGRAQADGSLDGWRAWPSAPCGHVRDVSRGRVAGRRDRMGRLESAAGMVGRNLGLWDVDAARDGRGRRQQWHVWSVERCLRWLRRWIPNAKAKLD